MVTETLRLFRIFPMDAAVIPFPTELTTPPVTKMYLVNLQVPYVENTEIPNAPISKRRESFWGNTFASAPGEGSRTSASTKVGIIVFFLDIVK